MGEDADSLRQRIRELEEENRQLRETVELQTRELLEQKRAFDELQANPSGPAADDPARVLLGRQEWNYAAGVLALSIFDTGDNVSRGMGNYRVKSDSIVGYELSAGKDRDRFGITVYQGQYTVGRSFVPAPGTLTDSHTSNDRVDIDLAWSRMSFRNEGFGFGYILGLKYLRSEKKITHFQSNALSSEEREYDGVNEWEVAVCGIFLSARLLQNYPLSAFASASASLGWVSGMVVEENDGIPDDGKLGYVYGNDSHTAWGLNGSLGLQSPVTSHAMVRAGYRGQGLNATDGFSPWYGVSSFYDGHQSVFAAVDVLF